MNNEIISRLTTLRTEMKNRKIDACIIPSCDWHNSEYVNECFKYRAYYSGFTGSAGTLYLTIDEAYLITDGRYFLQAENQLKGTGISLVRDGMENEPDIFELIRKTMKKSGVLFSDSRLMTVIFKEKLDELANDISITLVSDNSPVISALQNFPTQQFNPIYSLPLSLAGKSSLEKLTLLRDEMAKTSAQAHIITSLEEIAWLLNMRGSDIANTPVFYAYFYLTPTEAYAFLDKNAAKNVSDELNSANIKLLDYSYFYQFLSGRTEKAVLCDKSQVNAAVIASLPKDCKIIYKTDPAILAKAIKNDTEIENLKKTHLYDGLAVARFMHYVKNADKKSLTELSCTKKLHEFRRHSSLYLGDSFDTICAYGKNAAIIHYSATEESDTPLDESGALLVDSGGQYKGGTTDITRVFILGETSKQFKIHYTEVCRSMLKLQSAVFKKGTPCAVLDMLARENLWKLGLDYRHGTGHGIGYMLSVHEGPNRFHYANTAPIICAGMVTSDEPGMYVSGEYGIRIENEILCKNMFSSEYGDFLGFEPLTVCPVDLDAIIPEMLEKSEINALNEYHKFVYDSLLPFVDKGESEWLKYYTRNI